MKFIVLSVFLMCFDLIAISQDQFLFIGTYTSKGSKGIYVYKFNTQGEAQWLSNTDSVSNPSYLAVAANGKYVYALTETNPGSVISYSFDRKKGVLNFMNQQPSGGTHPCYLSVTKNNKWLVAGHYTSGNVSLFPLHNNGTINLYSQIIQHTGSGADKKRQEKAHVHATVLSPKEDYLFVPDLGMDKVMIYPFESNKQNPIDTSRNSFVISEPGSGPRHFTFHPNGKFAYLMEEMSGAVVGYTYKKGKLNFLQKISSHPENYKGTIGSADIHVSPDGRFLYASNRGDANTIAIFLIDAEGKLQAKGYQSTLGVKPRNFVIDGTGNYLLVANQETDNVVIFKRDKNTGLLTDTGNRIQVKNPVCLKMTK